MVFSIQALCRIIIDYQYVMAQNVQNEDQNQNNSDQLKTAA
jgi:hypothetical protein